MLTAEFRAREYWLGRHRVPTLLHQGLARQSAHRRFKLELRAGNFMRAYRDA